METIKRKLIDNYWQELLKNSSATNRLQLASVASSRITISTSSIPYFRKISAGKPLTEFTVLMTVYAVLLHRYFGEQPFIFSKGLPQHEQTPLLYNITCKRQTLQEQLQSAKAVVQDAFRYAAHSIAPGTFERHANAGFFFCQESEGEIFPFSLTVLQETNASWTLHASFDENFTTPAIATHFLHCFHHWLQSLENYLPLTVTDISIINDLDRELLLRIYTADHKSWQHKGLLVSQVEDTVLAYPDKVAVICEHTLLTYTQLNEAANQLAWWLMKRHQAGPGDIVAVKLPRNENLLIALLAVLKCGAAYVPVDVNYPEERQAYIEQDSRARLVLDTAMLQSFAETQHEMPATNPETPIQPENLAYIIYTSGSTGQPKGVMIAHKNAAAFLDWCASEFATSPFDIVYAATSHCFDLSIFEMFYTLIAGKKIRILQNALESPQYLQTDSNILLNTVPSVMRALLDEEQDLRNVSVINLAGEPFPPDVARKLVQLDVEVRNLYGPSEDTTYSTCYRLQQPEYRNVPIGRPIAYTQVYILDEALQLLPPGIYGRIFIAGDGLSHGYLHKPALTAEKFIANPFHEGKLMYDTGDIGRWLPDGNLEYYGRKDQQVKLNGFRIELGEIEHNILQFSADIQRAVADVRNAGNDKMLVGYYVAETAIDTASLKQYLAERLPAYMVPVQFFPLSEIPLNINGKVDRKALAALSLDDIQERAFVAPRTVTETRLTALWSRLLNRDAISVMDNFFEQGGHSLKLSRLAAQLHQEFDVRIPLRDLFSHPVLEDQARLIESFDKSDYKGIPLLALQEDYALSSSQRRMWLLSQLEEGSAAYHMSAFLQLEGKIDTALLENSFRQLIARHEILRTVFIENNSGDVRQVILSSEQQTFRLEIRHTDSLQQALQQDMSAPFDLSAGPLLRAVLYTQDTDNYILSFVMHHIISDGWSVDMLVREVLAHYNGHSQQLLPLTVQYKDYAAWQQQELQSPEMLDSRKYWMEQLSGELPVLEMPLDAVRPAVKTFRGNAITLDLPSAAFKQLLRQHDATLFMGVLSLVKILLHRYSGQEDIIVGSPVAGRVHADLAQQIGFYVNTLALRSRVNARHSFLQLLAHVKSVAMGAYEHQAYPFDELVESLELSRDLGRNALFDVLVVLQNNDSTAISTDHFSATPYEGVDSAISKFDLSFNFTELTEEVIRLRLEYNTDLYRGDTATRMAAHLKGILLATVADAGIPVGRLAFMAAEERQQILEVFNHTFRPFPLDKTLTDLWSAQVKRTPAHTALVFGDQLLTYEKLDQRSSQLSHFLREQYDVQARTIVGLKLERSEWMIITLLAIWKAGAAYLPIDPGYPEERVQYMIADSGCKVVVDENTIAAFLQVQKDYLASWPINHHEPEDLAYVIYTSGSTGKPKGVMVSHGNLVNYLFAINEHYQVDEQDRIIQISNIAFDASAEQVLLGLLLGASLHIISREDALDPVLLNQFLQEHRITHIHTVPALLEGVDSRADLPLKRMVSAGEACPPALANRWSGRLKFYNKYGPTEATISSNIYLVSGVEESSIPVGRPLNNTQVYILDGQMQLLPVGVDGELCIAGAGLARGYLNNPALTAERFIPHPFAPGEKLYRTGDVARWLPDGNVVVSGRADDQVKVRGYRIELGEITHAIQGYEGIQQAVVIAAAIQPGEKELIAYTVSATEIDIALLRNWLAARIPSYMVPGYFVALDSLPLTANGKVDKRRLPLPADNGQRQTTVIAPRNTTEARLADLWQQLLSREVSVTDNFFELGGHSLKLSRLATAIHQQFGVRAPLKELFLRPVLEEQAAWITGLEQHTYQRIPVLDIQEDYALSSSQRRMWLLSQLGDASAAYHMPAVLELEGALDRDLLENSFREVIRRHEILRTVFKENMAGEVRQHILPSQAIHFELLTGDDLYTDLSAPFDLSTGPLLRANLYNISGNRYLLGFVMHHIISDGWSIDVLIKEVLHHYNGQGQTQLPALPIQYKDYAAWQQSRLLSPEMAASKAYWLEQFSGSLPVLELPTDGLRPAIKTYKGDFVTMELPAAAFKSLLRSQDATLFMGLLSLVNILLYRYSSQEDIIIGSPVAGRDHSDLTDQLGFYVNTLALRTQLGDGHSFMELLKQVKTVSMGAYEHQAYPFDELIEALDLPRDLSRSALFDVMVVLQNNDRSAIDSQGLHIQPYAGAEGGISKFDLLFNFSEGAADTISMRLEYNTDLYHRDTVVRMATHLEGLLQAVVATPNTSLSRLAYLSVTEQNTLLHTFNDTAVAYPSDKSLAALFVEQAKRTPDKIALVYEDVRLSYEALDLLSNRLAQYLRQRYQVQRDELVGIQLERSEWTVITLMAILKSGGAYLPLDSSYPQERIDYMIADSGCRVVITSAELAYFQEHITAYSDQLPEQVNQSTDLAYVMYTSGSTGRPKGVMIEQRGVVRLVMGCNYVQLKGDEVLLSTGAVSFDATTFEYWSMLLHGGTLVMSSLDVLLDDEQLLRLINRERVTMMWFTAGWFHQLIDKSPNIFASLRTVLAGGDKLSATHIRLLQSSYPQLTIVNGYGPTENTTFSLCHVVEASAEEIPIGIPVSNSTAFVLDKEGQLCPVGVMGEICVGGDGLARGYLNNPDLTASKFIAHPFIPGERLYKTGDLGRWTATGTLLFGGRADDQVKVRGYRIELGEITHTIQGYEGIQQAVVIAAEIQPGEKELVAYTVGATDVDVALLRNWLSAQLPGYMVPGYFVALESLPLTANGKVDKRRLPLPAVSGQRHGAVIAPRNTTEARLADLWQQLLSREVSVTDNFFELGGHSLKLSRLAASIHQQLGVRAPLKELFLRPVLEEQAMWIAGLEQHTYQRIPVLDIQEDYALSSSQRRMWLLSQLGDASAAYHMPAVLELIGTLDSALLEESFQAVIERHEILRTVFKENIAGEVRQVVLPIADVRFALLKGEDLYTDLSAPFDLSAGPLLRAHLYEISENHCLLGFVMHHIISDGWSVEVLIKEVLHYYNSKGQTPLPVLSLQYKDYAAWQQSHLLSPEMATSKAYWLEQFSGSLPVLELPTDSVRPAVKTYKGDFVTIEVPSGAFKSLLLTQDATLFMGLLSLVNILLYRYSGQEDIIIGSPVAGREHADLADQLGFYVNTLALRTQLVDGHSFLQLLELVKTVSMGAYEHQSYPFDELVDALSLPRDLSRSALFDVMVVLQNNDRTAIASHGLEVRPYAGANGGISKFDLLFNFSESTADTMSLRLEYNTDLYQRETAMRMATHLEGLLQAVVATPDTSLSHLSYLSATEQHTLLQTFNDTAVAYPVDKSLATLFVEQVQRTPGNIALLYEEVRLSYEQVDHLSNRLAQYLRNRYQIQRDELVGIQLERGEWMFITLMAILKSGGAYLPLDLNYPQERIDYMIADSGCRVVITAAELAYFQEHAAAYSDELPEQIHSSTDLAYVIYTSGSTGKPKGVMIEQHSVVNLIASQTKSFQVQATDKILQFSALSFDASVEQIFLALFNGATLVIAPEATRQDPAAMMQLLSGAEITHFHATPSYLEMITPGAYKGLQRVIAGGEPCKQELAESWSGYAAFYNEYGPTETTVTNTLLRYTGRMNIGRPLENTRIYILDAQQQLQPVGVDGELCIAGAGLARGYLNNPVLTAERFVPHPYCAGEKLYRTGDVARWLPDGNIAVSGRADDQVKVRGYRIELGEITHAIQGYEGIQQAVVIAAELQPGEKELVAYTVSATDMDVASLRNWLSAQLPGYMVPGYFVALESLPLTANGKVDKRRLPLPAASEQRHTAVIAPRNTTEARLADLWQQLLSREVSVTDNFFELGGHSLKLSRLAASIHQQFGVRAPLKELFIRPVLEEQARWIAGLEQHTYQRIPVLDIQEDYALSSSQRRMWLLSQLGDASAAYHMPAVLELEGTLDITLLEASFQVVIERHEILRTVFKENIAGEVRQVVLPIADVHFALLKGEDLYTDLSAPFDLSAGPLLRAHLYEISENRCLLGFVMHHIISDGWSVEVLIKEVLHYYNSKGQTPLPALPLQYKDYAAWQQSHLLSPEMAASKAYWLDQFSGSLPVLELPTDSVRPAVKTYKGDFVTIEVPSGAFKSLLLTQDATLFMGLLSLVNILLYRYSGQEDIIIGSPVAGREHADLADQLGFYVNTLALRTQLVDGHSFLQLLEQVKTVSMGAYEHQSYPFDELVDALNLPRDLSRSALFDVMVVLQNNDRTAIDSQGLEVRPYAGANGGISKFDLLFNFSESTAETMSLRLEYNTDLYQRETAMRMATHLEGLLQAVVATPDTSLSHLSYLSATEQHTLLHTFNDTAVAYRVDKSLATLFVEQAQRTPGNIALVYEEVRLSYEEVDHLSNHLAQYLRNRYQIQRDELVGIQLERSEWMFITLMAILKSGGAYLPLDLNYPQERIDYMIADSGCRVVITATELAYFQEHATAYSDQLPEQIHSSTDLAYVIYTSGSTGKPKGVMIEQHSVVNLIASQTKSFQVQATDKILQFSALSFDASVEQIFLALLNGATLVIAPEATRQDPAAMMQLLSAAEITHFHATPSYLEMITPGAYKGLQRVIAGGEPCKQELAESWSGYAAFYNEYGPTETTVTNTLLQYTDQMNIGRPLENTRIYILDTQQKLQPVGVDGELCIAGAGLARGYLNNPVLTAERFVPHPYCAGEKLYRTGDVARWLPDGNIAVSGRADDQVKVRGYRIELGEIEQAILKQPSVKQVAVVVQQLDGDKIIAAFVVASSVIDKQQLKDSLTQVLPAYMVPSHYVQLEHIPLSSNGKTDRRLLPAVTTADIIRNEYCPPTNETESRLAEIWQEVLGIDKIGIRDNFFELGGHSLKATAMLSRVLKEFDVSLDLQLLFQQPTIMYLAENINNAQWLRQQDADRFADKIII
ncbi:tyrocidine synthetase-3 [Chitinophaga dinghuensis]|uniref:Tyrocidine synthetase-3 n=1 Tax=Chitinophaga dinghuensis TaxID=1539050 RepID=A0A327VRV7_9BACT|nr:non-ribosomal peptide synthetase [Chitinophaga dinghuensis]RAJ76809.1 tyrocidine synthetase-3 [Chitinophaga dinghuensis]